MELYWQMLSRVNQYSRKVMLAGYIALVSSCTTYTALLDPALERNLDRYLSDNKLREAYDTYQAMSEVGKSDPAIRKKFQQVQLSIALVRIEVERVATEAIAAGEWAEAHGAYLEYQDLMETSPAFTKNYQQFLVRLDAKKADMSRDYLVARAEYLVEKLAAERSIVQLDPYDLANKSDLVATEREARQLSKQLRLQGLDAVEGNDIHTARRVIPLARALDDSASVREAERALERATRPMEEYIVRLSDYAKRLYSQEDYVNALEIWEVVLYLDPGNAQVQANRERTLKVLQSLDNIKQSSGEEAPVPTEAQVK